jgi:hypothetical protein
LRKGEERLELTGDETLIKKLAGIAGRPYEIVIEGDWYSADNIKVSISSALVDPDDAEKRAQEMLAEQPVSAWLPTFYGSDEDAEYSNNEKQGYTPWVINPSCEARIDKEDPLGVKEANMRPRLAREFSDPFKITAADAFGRIWQNEDGVIALRAQAWGRDETDSDRGLHPGLRLLCSVSTIKKVLKEHNKTLLLLILLRRSERDTYRGSSKLSHTVAVVSISQGMKTSYLPGRINELHKDRW